MVIEESGQKFVELSIPAKGKQKAELMSEDISVTKVPLGQITTERLKQDTQTLIDTLFRKLDKEKEEKSKLQIQISQLCEIIAKVVKPSSQPVLAHEQVSRHLIEDAGNQVKAVAKWKEKIINQASEQFEEVPSSLEDMHMALSQLKQLMTSIEDENIVAESHLDTLSKINALSENVLIAEQIVHDGLIEKGNQLEIVSFRMEILKLMLNRMQLLEDKMREVSENIVAFTTEEEVDGIRYYTRCKSNKLLVSLEEFILVVQKKIDEAVMSFTLDSIGKLVRLDADIKEFGPSLEKVKEGTDTLSKGLLRFKSEKEVVAKADGKTLNHMFDMYIQYQNKGKA